MRPGAIIGISRFIDIPPWLLSFLGDLRHPFLAEPEPDFPDSREKIPCVIFSHGLAGNYDTYQKLCGDIASHGVIVVALEHEDGSGTYCAPLDSIMPLYYQSPPAPPWEYNRLTVPAFREKFLDKRVSEVRQVVQAIHQLAGRAPSPSLPETLLQRVDTDSLWMCGHSFGAASTVRVLQEEASFVGHNLSLKKAFKGCILLDIWSYALPDSSIQQGVNGLRGGVLSILGEGFANNGETFVTRELYKRIQFGSTPSPTSYWIPGCVHQQFSDVPYWVTPRVGKFVNASGCTPVSQTQQAIVRAIAIFLGVSAKNAATDDGVEDTWDRILEEEPLRNFE